jgi:threonine synthase
VIFSVPSGNFGNIGAGVLAWRMGLPVKQFIAATNVNDTVPQFFETGFYRAKPSVQTWSNAMDVGDPSNWVRIMDMLGGDQSRLKELMTACSFTDEETLQAIKEVYSSHDYIMCPHTAIAWLASKKWLGDHPGEDADIVFLSTAHPCKFPDIFPEDIAQKIDTPLQVRELEGRKKEVITLSKEFEEFKDFLLNFRSNNV